MFIWLAAWLQKKFSRKIRKRNSLCNSLGGMDFQSSCRSNKRGVAGTKPPSHQLTAHFHRHTREKRERDRGERERERNCLISTKPLSTGPSMIWDLCARLVIIFTKPRSTGPSMIWDLCPRLLIISTKPQNIPNSLSLSLSLSLSTDN